MASEEAAARPGGAGDASPEAKPYRVLEPAPDKRDALMRSRQDGEAALAAAQAAQAARRTSPAYDTHAPAAPVGGRDLAPEEAQRRREHQLLVAKMERAEKAAQARQQAKLEEERKIQQHRDRQRQLAEQQAARQQAAARSVQEQVREARLRKLAGGASTEFAASASTAAATATAGAAAAAAAPAASVSTPRRPASLSTQSLPSPTKQPSPARTTEGSAIVPERPASASGWTFGPPGGAAARAASASVAASSPATPASPYPDPHTVAPPPAYEHEDLPRYEEAAPSVAAQSDRWRPSPMPARAAPPPSPPLAARQPVPSVPPPAPSPEPVYGWLHLDDGSMVYIPRPGEEAPGVPLPLEEEVHEARPAEPALVDVAADVPASDAEARLVSHLYEMGLDAVEPGALLAALRASDHDVTQVLGNFNILP